MSSKKGFAYVIDTIEAEGFDYAFTGYSNFEEVQSEEFHKLRKEFLEARQRLADFLGVDE